jgi:glycosyltransferase involved in cell wall biosynthesis
MKKILIIQPSLAPYRIDFFNSLSEHFILKLLLLKENFPDNPFDQEKLRNSLHFDTVILKNVLYVKKRLIPFGLRGQITLFRPDAVICSEFSLANNLVLLTRLFSRKKFRVFTLTDDNEFMISRPENPIKKVNQQFLLRFLDGIITLDIPEVVNYYSEQAGPLKVIGIQHLIRDADIYRAQLYSARSLSGRSTEQGFTDKTRLLFVGRLVPEKGLDMLIKAFDTLKNKYPDLQLYIVGDGPEKRKINKLVQKYGHDDSVFLEGRKEGDQLLQYYLNSDIFVLPSRYEPFGAVVNEALLAGLPVICSDRVGAKCLIKEGNTGNVFNLNETDGLGSAIEFWINRISQPDWKYARKNLLSVDLKQEIQRLKSFIDRFID